jgi:hypothetical protein
MYSSDDWIRTFEDIASHTLTIRIIWHFFDRVKNSPLGLGMIIGFGFFSSLKCIIVGSDPNDIIALTVYPNEYASIIRLRDMLLPKQLHISRVQKRNVCLALFMPGLLLCLISTLLRSHRLLRKLSKQSHFVTICQSASLLGCYAAASYQLSKQRPVAVVVSSISIPEPFGLVAAAARWRIPTIFASHASFAPDGRALVPPTDLILMDGTESLQACKQVTKESINAVCWGISGQYRPIKIPDKPLKDLILGLFLTAPVNMNGLFTVLSSLELNLISQNVMLRPHPIAMLSPNFTDLLSRFSSLSVEHGLPLENALEKCDLIISSNSNVHREALRAGVPCLYVSTLDTVGFDYWHFVKNQVVMEVHSFENLSLSQVAAFYDKNWQARFQKYDAAYLEPPEKTKERVCAAIENLIEKYGNPPL